MSDMSKCASEANMCVFEAIWKLEDAHLQGLNAECEALFTADEERVTRWVDKLVDIMAQLKELEAL